MKLNGKAFFTLAVALSGACTYADELELDGISFNHETQVAAACAEQFGVSYQAAACIVGQLSAQEVAKCFEDGFGGESCFGDNNTFVGIVSGNIEAAADENGVLNQVIRGTTGISVRDIEERGVLGGDNSEARKACNAVAGISGGRC